MKRKTLLMPFQREHSLFREIINGRKNIIVDMAKIADLSAGDEPEDIAQDIYEIETQSQGQFKQYIRVEKPLLVNGQWVIHKFLTKEGEEIYDSLEGGVLWNTAEQKPDFEATETYYDDMMASGSIDMRFVELLAANKDERLKSLRGKLVYFKMQGQKTGDRITNLVA